MSRTMPAGVTLPAGVREEAFANAFREFRQIVGDRWVISDGAELAKRGAKSPR